MPNDIIYFRKKKKAEQGVRTGPSSLALAQKIANFIRDVESIYYSAFKGSETPKVETERTLLQVYLNSKSYREVQMAAGNSDLLYPDEHAIIETKIWRGERYFRNGLAELTAYLESQGYTFDYYVVFYNTRKKTGLLQGRPDIFNIVIKDNIEIRCVFVDINPTAPSKKKNLHLRSLKFMNEEHVRSDSKKPSSFLRRGR